MAVGRGTHNSFPILQRRLTRRLEDIRHEEADALKGYLEEESPVDTGFLSMSYVTFETGKQSTVVASNAEYAVSVNDGHHTSSGSWVPGQHFRARAISRLKRLQRKRRLL